MQGTISLFMMERSGQAKSTPELQALVKVQDPALVPPLSFYILSLIILNYALKALTRAGKSDIIYTDGVPVSINFVEKRTI